MTRHDWTVAEIRTLYNKPLLEIVFEAASIHRKYFDSQKIQLNQLVSLKTGGCPEDCHYCPQSARYNTGLTRHGVLDKDEVITMAKKAKNSGVSRMCLGAAWREVKDNKQFEKILEIVEAINSLDMEVCCTLGMLNEQQAKRLKSAGLYAYNHNIDSSPDYYSKVISTRKFEDRLQTLDCVRKANLSVCCGGIIGMGETDDDRIKFLHTLSTMNTHPDSVPINTLVAVKGTPLEKQNKTRPFELVRMVALARILMPKSWVRLSAGRLSLTDEAQALCFLAGANSFFSGDKLLTTSNPSKCSDADLLEELGLEALSRVKKYDSSFATS